jgi:hypothetical protein
VYGILWHRWRLILFNVCVQTPGLLLRAAKTGTYDDAFWASIVGDLIGAAFAAAFLIGAFLLREVEMGRRIKLITRRELTVAIRLRYEAADRNADWLWSARRTECHGGAASPLRGIPAIHKLLPAVFQAEVQVAGRCAGSQVV